MLTKEAIVKLLATNDKAVARAVAAINTRQTRDEQASENTKYNNGVGFTGADARMGTSMALFFQRRGYLSPKQIAYWRKPNKNGTPRIAKYAGQLLEIAAEKAALAKPAVAVPVVVDPGNAAEAMQAEREMQAMEAEADREQTRIDELNKFVARCQMEKAAA